MLINNASTYFTSYQIKSASLKAKNMWNYCLYPVTNDDRHPSDIIVITL